MREITNKTHLEVIIGADVPGIPSSPEQGEVDGGTTIKRSHPTRCQT